MTDLMLFAGLGLAGLAAAFYWLWTRYGDSIGLSEEPHWHDRQIEEKANLMYSSEDLETFAAAHPNVPAPLARWVQMAMESGDWAETARRAEIFQKRFPKNIYGYLAGGKALSLIQKFDDADALLLRAQKIFPHQSRVFLDHAEIANIRKDWPEARRRWQALQRRFPGEVKPFSWEALAVMEMGDIPAAEQVFASALARFPEDRDLAIWYAEAARRRGDWSAAAQRWAYVRVHHDARIEGYTAGAEALRRCGRFDDAAQVLDDAAFIFKEHPALTAERRALAEAARPPG